MRVMPVEQTNCHSETILVFLDGFLKQYETQRGFQPGNGPNLVAPDARASAEGEVKRAFDLADAAARKWAPWALEGEHGAGAEQARGFMSQIKPVVDHDSADDTEGVLMAAFKAATGHARVAIGAARDAVTHAKEIELDLPGADNSKAVADTARAAGEALAAASVSNGQFAQAITEAQVKAEDLR
jgi:hypothetical protein